MHRNLTNLIIVFALIFVITACVCKSDREKENQTPVPAESPSPSANRSTSPSNGSTSTKADGGDFKVEHIAISNSKYAQIDREVKKARLLENAAERLNRALILPYDIQLRTKDCGETNAFYDSNDQTITVCYELMEHYYEVFRETGTPEDKAYEKMFDAVRFIFLHEIGHALIDVYELPITGNEEDAADRCSAFINLNELGEEGVSAVFAAADAFKIESKRSGPSKSDLADEHLLQEQRFYNSLCMIYGSNSSKYENIVTDGYLPKARADRCQTEYQRTAASWANLLKPWRK